MKPVAKFSVFEAVTTSLKMVLDNIKLYSLLVFTYLATIGAAVLAIMVINIPLYNAVKKSLYYCTGAECIENFITAYTSSGMPIYVLILSVIIIFLLFISLWFGFEKALLDIYDTGDSKVKTLFSCFHLVPKLIVTILLYLGIIISGLIFFIIPGIYWGMRFMFCTLFIIDKDAGIIESLKKSWRITEGQTWNIWSIILVFSFLNALSLTSLSAKFLFTISISVIGSLIWIFVYRKLAK